MANSSALDKYHKKYPSLEQKDFVAKFGSWNSQSSSIQAPLITLEQCVMLTSCDVTKYRYFKKRGAKQWVIFLFFIQNLACSDNNHRLSHCLHTLSGFLHSIVTLHKSPSKSMTEAEN
jgi:hypothetical protein